MTEQEETDNKTARKRPTIMENEKYNGFTNRETWLVNLWYGYYLTESAEETGRAFTADEVREHVEEIVFNLLDLPKSGFIADILGGSLARINWHEVAERTEVPA